MSLSPEDGTDKLTRSCVSELPVYTVVRPLRVPISYASLIKSEVTYVREFVYMDNF